MKPFFDLFRQPEFRQWVAFPFKSMGYSNFAKSIIKAKRLNKGPARNLPRYLLPELWKNLGSRKAVVSDDGTVSFSELSERALRLANSFHRQGLTKHDRVAILLNNEQGWFDTMAACMFSGIKMPMLNTHLKPNELVKCINDSAPKILVISASFIDTIKSIEAELNTVELFVCAGSEETFSSKPNHYIALEKLIADGVPVIENGGFGLPQMAFSGGSTGVPKFIVEGGNEEVAKQRKKGISKTELKQLQAKLVYGLSLVSAGKIEGQIVSLIPGPLYHAGVQVAVFPLYFGGTVVPMAKFDAEKFLQLIELQQANFTFVAPTMLERILKLPESTKAKYDLSSMQVIFCAAAPCADYVKKGINALFRRQGAKVNVFHEYYGSSESAVISVLQPEHYEEKPERYKSVGKIAGCECIVYKPEERRKCSPGEDGHVVIRTSRMYDVNYGNSNDMNDSFIDIDGVLWFDDGCIGHLDEDGFLYLTSRSKDMIISGGVNVFPVEIEEVIKRHNDIMDVAVIKVADEDLGEVPGALIQTVNGHKISDQELIKFCKDNGLYGFKLPKHVKYTKTLPKNNAGKIRKKDLEKEFIESTPVNVIEVG